MHAPTYSSGDTFFGSTSRDCCKGYQCCASCRGVEYYNSVDSIYIGWSSYGWHSGNRKVVEQSVHWIDAQVLPHDFYQFIDILEVHKGK